MVLEDALVYGRMMDILCFLLLLFVLNWFGIGCKQCEHTNNLGIYRRINKHMFFFGTDFVFVFVFSSEYTSITLD